MAELTEAQKKAQQAAADKAAADKEDSGNDGADNAPSKELGDKNKVKNISDKTLYLANGKIEKGKVGVATLAECRNHYKHLELV